MTDDNQDFLGAESPAPKVGIIAALRRYFITGLVISAPVFITFYLVIWIIGILDGFFRPFIPVTYRPETYLPIDIPGVGVVMALIVLTLIGWFAANFLGRGLVALSDRVIERLPVIGCIYKALRQIFKDAIKQGSSSFSQVALIEYPRRGLYCIAFVTSTANQVIKKGANGLDMIAVFLPTTPNPTSGFLLFVPKDDVVILDMTVEEGARLVISAGMTEQEDVIPPQ